MSGCRVAETSSRADVVQPVQFMVYIFSEEGLITIDGENTTVVPGSVKTNVAIEGWPFEAEGAFLDLQTRIKVRVVRDAGTRVHTAETVGYVCSFCKC